MATGNIRKRIGRNGAVTYQITVEDERNPLTGKRERTYKTIKGTKKQAEAELRRMISEVETGGVIKTSNIRLGDWLTEWVNTYLINIEATTKAGYKERIKTCIIPYLGDIPIRSLRNENIQAWVNAMITEKNLAPKTKKNAYLNIKAALDKAVVLRMIPYNPCIGVELPKHIKYHGEIYDNEEMATALKIAKGTEMFLPLLLGLSLGLRRGEITALQWGDIDFDKGDIYIQRNMVLAEGKIIIKEPKSEAGKRHIAIGEKVVSELKKAYEEYQKDKAELGSLFYDWNYVVRQKNGHYFRPDSLTRKWKRFTDSNNLKHIRLHDLRHSCATAMITSGVDPKTVQDRLGHADVSVTMSIYAHSTRATNKAAADKIDDVVLADF